MKFINDSFLKDCMPDALALASTFCKEFTELELIKISIRMQEMIRSGGFTATRYRKFYVAYLAICICVEAPIMLKHLSRDVPLAS